ncbi:MAG: glycosyltransferase family 2 protein [Myxococcota bacterium]
MRLEEHGRPTVGVIVPNFNGARFLRECLDSVLAQEHPVRCLVMDGGSTDASVEILESYGDAVEWISEPDEGQADAIDKGFRRMDTDLVGWLNSDDRYLPGAVGEVVEASREDPEAVLFHGHLYRVDVNGAVIGETRSVSLDRDILRSQRGRIVQPGSFYRREAVARAGGVNPSFHLLMDLDLWIRLLGVGPAHLVDDHLAEFRVHEDAKSSQAPLRYYRETLRIGWLHERDRPIRAALRRVRGIVRHRVLWGIRRRLGRVQ